jgi:hypothetical protein
MSTNRSGLDGELEADGSETTNCGNGESQARAGSNIGDTGQKSKVSAKERSKRKWKMLNHACTNPELSHGAVRFLAFLIANCNKNGERYGRQDKIAKALGLDEDYLTVRPRGKRTKLGESYTCQLMEQGYITAWKEEGRRNYTYRLNLEKFATPKPPGCETPKTPGSKTPKTPETSCSPFPVSDYPDPSLKVSKGNPCEGNPTAEPPASNCAPFVDDEMTAATREKMLAYARNGEHHRQDTL